MIDKTKGWFRYSLTIFWARLLSLIGLMMEVLYQAADILQVPAITEQIHALFPQKYWPVYLLVIGVTTELARRRKGSSDPV